MGQKVNPTGFRLPVNRAWRSRWFAPKKAFGDLLVEDQKIREYVKKRLAEAEEKSEEKDDSLNGTALLSALLSARK